MNPLPKTYIITTNAQGVNLAAFAQYLYDSADVIAFWNYIPFVYCIKSFSSAAELTQKFLPFFPLGGFLIAEIDRLNIEGRLQQAAWEWFYLDHHHKARPPSLPNPQSLLPFLPPMK